jgi:hypothetical protein
MRALTVEELGFVSGGGNNRPWNPYTDFKAPEPSKKYLEYEAMITESLKEQGLDYWGNPQKANSEGALIYSSDGSVSFATPLERKAYDRKNPVPTTTTTTVTFDGVTFIQPDGTRVTVVAPPH